MNESIIPHKTNTVSECRRLIPRGVRNMIATKRPLDDMPEAARDWLKRHELIRPNKRAGEPGQGTWVFTKTGQNLERELLRQLARTA